MSRMGCTSTRINCIVQSVGSNSKIAIDRRTEKAVGETVGPHHAPRLERGSIFIETKLVELEAPPTSRYSVCRYGADMVRKDSESLR